LPDRGHAIKRTILARLAALVVFVVAAFLSTVYAIERQTREDDVNGQLASVGTLLRQKMAASAGLMHATVSAMVTNQAIAAALADEDRVGLLQLVEPLFARLRHDHGITHLYFTQPDLVNLLRLHDRAQHGDTIDRFTTRHAAETGKSASGLELGPLGTLALRSVTPWRRDGRVIGYVELGKELEPILIETARSLGLDIYAFVDRRLLAREAWDQGLRLLRHAPGWPDGSGYALAAQTPSRFDPALLGALQDVLARPGLSMVDAEGRQLALAALPLDDAAGRTIGRLVVVSDRTPAQTTFIRWLTLATALSTLAGLLVYVSFHRALAGVAADYRRQHDLERRLLRVSGEHQRLVQVEKLSAMGTMIGEIAHQLNNPLVGVVNMAQLAERCATNPERLRPLLAEIRQAGQDCGTFVKRMLDFTRASSFDGKRCDLRPIIDDAVALFRHSVGRRVAVERIGPDQPAWLEADPILLRHALFNLLANAAQAMQGGGRVTIMVEAAPGGEGQPGWRVAVDDEGPGLTDEVRQRIFTPFFTTRPDGTGLGLAVVMHIVLQHEGTVEADNRPGGGARFALWFPQAADPPLRREDPA
jgi:signal transduction histidine kinase